MKSLLLIDANSLIRRFFHALPPLTNPRQEPVQAIYGLSNVLLKMWRSGNPDYAAALYDRPEPTFRKTHYEAYKAHRPPMPDGLAPQLNESKELFRRFGIRTFESPGMEADDLIATLVEKFRHVEDVQLVVLTGDSDLFQLVQDDKVVVRTFKVGVGDTVLYNDQAVRERYGLEPSQILDYKALVGDPSDNIKGVPGIGPKTATRLLQDYGTIENLYENLDKEPKLSQKLQDNTEPVQLAKLLLTLRRDVPVEAEKIEDLEIVSFDAQELAEYLQAQGFESLVKKLKEFSQEFIKEKTPTGSGKKGTKKKVAAAQPVPLGGLFETPASDGSALQPQDAPEDGVLFIGEGEEWHTFNPDYLSKRVKVGFGLKELIKEMRTQKKDLVEPYFDLSVAYWLLDPDFKTYAPEFVFKRFFKRDWKGDKGDYQIAFDFARDKLSQYGMTKILQDIEMPTLRLLAEMEQWGAFISVKKLGVLEQEIEKDITRLIKEIHKLAGEEFNINSPQQLGKVLFEKLGLKSRSRKSTGHLSTNVDVLTGLRDAHPIVPLVLEYREDFKIQSTYVKPLQALGGEDNRLHTHFIQTGAGTGRLSSQAPNLQNIPQGSKWSQSVRSAFEAPKGHTLISFDYSQLELRLLAALAADPDMMRAFRQGTDIHALTASKILRIPLDKVTNDNRRLAKTLNFGLAYGMGVVAFSKTSGLPRKEAKEFIEAYFHEFSHIRQWQEQTKQDVRMKGYAQTLTGRRRYFPGIRSPLSYIAGEAERAAINHPVQGLEADIIKLAMIAAKDELTREKMWGKEVKMILSIHDELLFEVRDDMIERVSRAIARRMEDVYPQLPLPLKIEVKAGKDWGHMKHL